MNVSRQLVRAFTTSSRRTTTDVHPGYLKIRSKMRSYQVDDGLPIHLKGGVFDKLLFTGTIGLNGVGLFMCLQFFYEGAFPKKPAE
ncbi:cytochrome c oxidase subunit 7A, mitochondrial-like [Oratosquilla oratoria]|uniref:cytochrome c oxidase subunit 7A, mitochondrial-like n=1 Tax=Oratosquilla oratoria TaxID=337810 RepID=UPI003F75E170